MKGLTSVKTIQILGTGCAKCEQLAEHAKAAAEQLGLEYQLVKVTKVDEISRFGVMFTPALAVDGQVKSAGKVLDTDAIKTMLAATE